ncbi:MAG: 4Fe-4S binding protein [Desulfobacterales bacterium]|nr:MAG: 4Fe-4S binding protein [Desulfobacterales bacterium]
MQDIYLRLAKHLEKLVMGYPFNEALPDLLREMFSPVEAQVALAIPNNLAPLEVVNRKTIVDGCDLSESTIDEALKSLADRNMLYSRTIEAGETGYGLLQVGYGIPQTFFWAGRNDAHARRMAKLVLNYFNVPTTQKVYGPVPTKTYKYAPANVSIDIAMQGVMPNEQMAPIVAGATKIAVAHCPCRMSAKILGRTDCQHSLEVCIKYDELAEFVISKELAREISKDEAHQILADCEKEGLVHMVDNTQGQIKHTCNCCGHYCWNVGIIRRRKIPRDMLMAVYFTRETELDACIGCGACAGICPVDAVTMVDDRPEVDQNWCIGCGVCAVTCPAGVISINRRLESQAPESFADLHRKIKQEKGLQ